MQVLTLWIVASPLEILDVINEETYFNLLYLSRSDHFSPIVAAYEIRGFPYFRLSKRKM